MLDDALSPFAFTPCGLGVTNLLVCGGWCSEMRGLPPLPLPFLHVDGRFKVSNEALNCTLTSGGLH